MRDSGKIDYHWYLRTGRYVHHVGYSDSIEVCTGSQTLPPKGLESLPWHQRIKISLVG